jgi:hypothetical protein
LENGFSYECRSLLIKALHNLIERLVWKFSPLFCSKMVLTNNFWWVHRCLLSRFYTLPT